MKILIFLLFPFASYSQIIYNGNVVNKKTKQPVSFVTVGLVKENSGTNTDENGKFILTLGRQANDTLIISCAGYATTKFPVDDLPANKEFEITERQILLSNIIVKNNYTDSYTLNDYGNCGINDYTSTGSVTQIAQHLHAPVENSLLSEIGICKRTDHSVFRLRVYDMDSISGEPSIDLADTIIEIKSDRKHIQVNLEKYHIIIPGKDFFVGIEWLIIPANERKLKMKKEGKKINYTQYSPYIFIKKRNNNDQSGQNVLESWRRDFRGKWIGTFPGWIFLISAKVKS